MMLKRVAVFLFNFFIICSLSAQDVEEGRDSLLYSILSDKDPLLQKVLSNPGKYSFQLLYTRVDKTEEGLRFEEHAIHKDQAYFYPASLIKFPLAIVALELITSWKAHGIDLQTPLRLQTCSCDQATNQYVRKSRNPTLQQFLREMMIMSDNDAYNLFFDITGMDHCNLRLRELGMHGIFLKRRFYKGCSDNQNRQYGGVRFLNRNDSLLFQRRCDSASFQFTPDSTYPLNIQAAYDENGNLRNGAKQYQQTNFVRLADAHQLLMRLCYPSLDSSSGEPFQLDSVSRSILIKAMGDFPRELTGAQQNFSRIPDHYYKFFLDPKTMRTDSGGIRIYNKVGLAGGFLSDVSYVEDKKNNIAYFLSASILARKDGELKGNDSDYYHFGIPVLRKIGALIYQYELGITEKGGK